jgi:tetratricopeptide (TPR) repeat protein
LSAVLFTDILFWHRATDTEVFPKVRETLLHAIEIDPNLGEGYGILGGLEMYLNNLDEALRCLRKSIELSPGYLPAKERLAWIHIKNDDIEKGLELIVQIIERDPLSTRYRGAFSQAFIILNRYEESLAFLKEYLDQFGDDNYILWPWLRFIPPRVIAIMQLST